MGSGSRRLRLAIAGGGTGGHVLPALAVVDELRARGALDDLLWIGSSDGIEGESASKAGIRFVAIPTGKLRRYLSLRNVLDAGRVPLGMAAARRALARFRPDAVLSTGGFVSVPTVIAAKGVAPVLTHEQTAILGLATRINARFAALLAVSHEQTAAEARTLHRNVVVTGNPVRPALAQGDRLRALRRFGLVADLPLVYVTGGARGASPINQRIGDLLPGLLETTQIVHQTGPASANADARSLTERRATFPERLRGRYAIVDFVGEGLPDLYAAADLIVGRAGAGTVAELALVGKPSVLIPLPHAGGGEQNANARMLEHAGAAVVVPQHEANPERLGDIIAELLSDPGRRARMAAAARAAAHPNAAACLADALLEMAHPRA